MLLGNILQIFLDLKDAENFQLKERLNLQKVFFSLFLNFCLYQNRILIDLLSFHQNIANVQATYKKRSAKNQSLKRMKVCVCDFNAFPFSLFFFYSDDLET